MKEGYHLTIFYNNNLMENNLKKKKIPSGLLDLVLLVIFLYTYIFLFYFIFL